MFHVELSFHLVVYATVSVTFVIYICELCSLMSLCRKPTGESPCLVQLGRTAPHWPCPSHLTSYTSGRSKDFRGGGDCVRSLRPHVRTQSLPRWLARHSVLPWRLRSARPPHHVFRGCFSVAGCSSVRSPASVLAAGASRPPATSLRPPTPPRFPWMLHS